MVGVRAVVSQIAAEAGPCEGPREIPLFQGDGLVKYCNLARYCHIASLFTEGNYEYHDNN